MTGKGHTQVGIAFSFSVAYLTYTTFTEGSILLSGLSMFFFIIGATAPDWLEIRKKNGSTVITHRTITHWFPIWIGLFFLAIQIKETNCFNLTRDYPFVAESLYISISAFSVGALLHLITDLPNPLGIPLPTPYKRFSLNLWKSGNFEIPIIVCSYLINLGYIGIDTGILVIDIHTIKALLNDI